MSWTQGRISDCLNLTGLTGGEKKNLMITRELINKIYPFFASLSIITAGIDTGIFWAFQKKRI